MERIPHSAPPIIKKQFSQLISNTAGPAVRGGRPEEPEEKIEHTNPAEKGWESNPQPSLGCADHLVLTFAE